MQHQVRSAGIASTKRPTNGFPSLPLPSNLQELTVIQQASRNSGRLRGISTPILLHPRPESDHITEYHFPTRSIPTCTTGCTRHTMDTETLIFKRSGHTNWDKQAFASMMLMSRSRFCSPSSAAKHIATIGPIWRVGYPSRFGRDVLCCDILLSSFGKTQNVSRIRLINVHLDSPVFPTLRPRQLSIIASYIRAAGYGSMAGDFSPVLPGDQMLISDNSVVDAWTELHPTEDGITWGLGGDTPFPPERMDKVALVGPKPCHIQVIRPGTCVTDALSGVEDKQAGPGKGRGKDGYEDVLGYRGVIILGLYVVFEYEFYG